MCSVGGTPVDLTVTFTGEGPWTFVPTLNTVAQPPITTNDNPYTFTVTQAGNWGLQSVSTVTSKLSGYRFRFRNDYAHYDHASGTPTAATCGQSNGAINLSVTGGTAPYMFEWSNSETTEDLADIPGGAYTVTVTDDNGCTGTASINVGDNPIAFSVTGSTQPNTTCIGGNSAAITTNVNPAGDLYVRMVKQRNDYRPHRFDAPAHTR